MSVLIVVESHFGNTTTVGREIASGLSAQGVDVTVLRPDEAPATIPPDVRLLLVGSPTHNLHLPSATTRQKAAGLGGEQGSVGLAEWIAALAPRPEVDVVTFDTVIAGAFSGSAAKAAVKLLRRAGFASAERGESFVVNGTKGPLREGEDLRAREWGAALAARR